MGVKLVGVLSPPCHQVNVSISLADHASSLQISFWLGKEALIAST